MPEGNAAYTWNERIRRLEDAIERNWQDYEPIDRNLESLRASMVAQKENVDKLLGALRELIDRIRPESLC